MLYPPVPFTGEDGRTHLVHELILANYTPGSVTVERVDVIDQDGRVDAPSAIVAQGLPYLIDSFTVTGRSASTAAFDAAEADGIPLATLPGLTPTTHTDQMVLDQAIVTFGETP